jgi:hypothetical protein
MVKEFITNFTKMALNPPTIPVALINLFEDAGFLAAAEPHHKPCIKSKYYVDDRGFTGWYGWFLRRLDRENPDKTKNFIRKVCDGMAQALNTYSQTVYLPIITNKTVALRAGVAKIQKTYENDCLTRGHIEDSITILDMALPMSVKLHYGIVAPPKIENLPKPTADGKNGLPAPTSPIPIPTTATPRPERITVASAPGLENKIPPVVDSQKSGSKKSPQKSAPGNLGGKLPLPTDLPPKSNEKQVANSTSQSMEALSSNETSPMM